MDGHMSSGRRTSTSSCATTAGPFPNSLNAYVFGVSSKELKLAFLQTLMGAAPLGGAGSEPVGVHGGSWAVARSVGRSCPLAACEGPPMLAETR